MEPLLEAENLTRCFGERRAVDGIGLTVRAGEVLGLLGPNGAGKSTTMRMLSGCLAPHAGCIRIDGLDLVSRPREAKRRVGYLPERPPLYPELTVDEYLRFAARLRGLGRQEAGERLGRVKRRCGLADSGRRLIANLSRGYQQRLGIAQAIIHAPPVVILDEPTTGLDPLQNREVRELIGELGQGSAVLLSTHILPEVQALCSRALIIHQGRLVYGEDLRQGAGRAPGSVLIALQRPPDAAALAALQGVGAVHPLGDGRFRLDTAPSWQADRTLAELIAGQGWGLDEYAPQRPGLEQIFVDIAAGQAG